MKRTTILLSALLCLSVQINAQGLLKSLKNKAVNALTEKVVNKVKGKNQPTSSDTPSATTSPSFSESAADASYAKRLGPSEEDSWSLVGSVGYDEDKDVQKLKFADYKDALAAIVALPTAEQVATEQVQDFVAKQAQVEMAITAFDEEIMQKATAATFKSSELARQLQSERAKTAQKTNSALAALKQPSPAELMQAIKDAGLNIEEATEEQIENAIIPLLAKKNGMTVAEMQKLADKEKQEQGLGKGIDRVADIASEISDITMNFQSSIVANQTGADGIENELKALRLEIIQAWPNSPECAKVEQMEQELSSKVNAWMNDNDKTWNDEMPAFWGEGRKAQNAVIDKWNTQQAEKWNSVVKKHIDAAMPDAQKFVNLATELQTLEDNNADVGYKLAYNDAQKACMTLVVLMLKPLLQMPAYSLDMPKVSHTPTENGI